MIALPQISHHLCVITLSLLHFNAAEGYTRVTSKTEMMDDKMFRLLQVVVATRPAFVQSLSGINNNNSTVLFGLASNLLDPYFSKD